MPFTSTICCCRMWLNTMFRMGTESFNVWLKLWRLLKPSSNSRRRTRSSTNDCEIPKSSNVWGTLGANPLRMGASVAAMNEKASLSSSAVIDQLFIHACGQKPVKLLVKFCGLFCGWWMAMGAWGAPTAELLFQQAQKAEHAGQIVRAYLLYAQAAAAEPGNLAYWERAQALRPMASLMKETPALPKDLAPEKVDRTLFGSV